MCTMPTWAIPSSSQLGKGVIHHIRPNKKQPMNILNCKTWIIDDSERDESRPYD